MQIQSAFNTGVQGFQRATEDVNQAALNIATNAIRSEDYNIAQENNGQGNSVRENGTQEVSAGNQIASQTNNITNVNQSIIDLRVAEFQARASGEIISSADENLGTLLDVRV